MELLLIFCHPPDTSPTAALPFFSKLKEVKTNQEWLRALQGGDERALAYFFETYYRALCFFANEILNDTAEAEDVVSESFFKLWKSRESITEPAQLTNFLYSVTRNACFNALRSKKRLNQRQQGFVAVSDVSQASVEELIIEAEMLRELYQRISVLPAQCKMIIEAMLEGKTPKEISAVSGLSVKTISGHKKNGLRRLRGKGGDD